MKIEYLNLINYANIKTAFNTDEIKIDFTKCKNRVILLTGPNGSGKTSILSCLHPFATNGTLDIRNDNPLIIEGEKGYKEIRINDDGNIYEIKHYYTPSDNSFTVKSYISRNGLELNVNGNVKSFKDIVKDELDIEIDYMKLSRLGNNVTNFIDLKATERKAFMGKILEDVDLYLKYFKKLTIDMRSTKSIISHLIDKISKLNILDIEELIKEQHKIKKDIAEKKDRLTALNGEVSIIQHEIDKYESPIVIKEAIDEKGKSLSKMYKTLEKHGKSNITIDECDTLIKDIEKSIIVTELELSSANSKNNEYLNSLDKLFSERNQVEKELSKIEEFADIKDIKCMISEIKSHINERASKHEIMNYSYTFSKKELEELIVMLDRQMEILYTTYEFGKEPIRKAIEYIENGRDISDYVSDHTEKVSKNRLQVACEFVYQSLLERFKMTKPNCDKFGSCSVMDFYNTLYEYATKEPDNTVQDDEFVMYTKMAFQNINTVLKNLTKETTILQKLPDNIKNMFLVKNILKRISNLESLYDRTIMYGELSLVTEYELQQEDLKTLQDLKDKLNLVKKAVGNDDYFQKRKDDIQKEISEIDSCIAGNLDVIEKNTFKLNDLEHQLTSARELKDSIENKDIVEKELENLSSIYSSIRELYSKKKEYAQRVEDMTFVYDKLVKTYHDNEYRIESYKSLSKELSSYNTSYDEMELVRNSLSSKEGIPLLYIQIYLKNIQEITNELLDIIYDGDLCIEDFKISADEFKIPFVTKETSIKDVCYASQGEKSFISLALSFALIYQSISRYNIMLLDEIDSTLDTSNREKFLQVLEKQMDMTEAEQIFVISHNNMFNMYPVDIIDTKNKINKDNKLSNYIPIYIR